MKYERDAPILPTVERVRAASEEFNKEYSVIEQALKELFGQYRGNNNHPHVLLKVVALNRLYSAGILGVHDAAYHIYQHAQEIDAALTDGAPEAVDRIAKVKIGSSGKQLKFWSFASKYCSWHNQPSYPIWDSRVCRYSVR